MNLNILTDLSKRLRDEIKMYLYQMQCRLNTQRRSQQSACNLDTFINAALEDEKLEKFDFFEQ